MCKPDQEETLLDLRFATTVATDRRVFHSVRLQVIPHDTEFIDCLRRILWEKIDEYANSFSMLEDVTVVFDATEDFWLFLDTVVPRLSRLDGASKLRYRIPAPQFPYFFVGTQQEIRQGTFSVHMLPMRVVRIDV